VAAHPPRQPRKRESHQGRWGRVNDIGIEKLSLQILYPPAGRGNGTPTKDDGVGLEISAAVNRMGMEKFSLQVL
jgi:hypothetical protein